ncbi:MAG: hypothetical protein J1F38_05650 [Muribaculaceae bacterium]|nr:hypothetical protein [Muribaculaceae bacterium]
MKKLFTLFSLLCLFGIFGATAQDPKIIFTGPGQDLFLVYIEDDAFPPKMVEGTEAQYQDGKYVLEIPPQYQDDYYVAVTLKEEYADVYYITGVTPNPENDLFYEYEGVFDAMIYKILDGQTTGEFNYTVSVARKSNVVQEERTATVNFLSGTLSAIYVYYYDMDGEQQSIDGSEEPQEITFDASQPITFQYYSGGIYDIQVDGTSLYEPGSWSDQAYTLNEYDPNYPQDGAVIDIYGQNIAKSTLTFTVESDDDDITVEDVLFSVNEGYVSLDPAEEIVVTQDSEITLRFNHQDCTITKLMVNDEEATIEENEYSFTASESEYNFVITAQKNKGPQVTVKCNIPEAIYFTSQANSVVKNTLESEEDVFELAAGTTVMTIYINEEEVGYAIESITIENGTVSSATVGDPFEVTDGMIVTVNVVGQEAIVYTFQCESDVLDITQEGNDDLDVFYADGAYSVTNISFAAMEGSTAPGLFEISIKEDYESEYLLSSIVYDTYNYTPNEVTGIVSFSPTFNSNVNFNVNLTKSSEGIVYTFVVSGGEVAAVEIVPSWDDANIITLEEGYKLTNVPATGTVEIIIAGEYDDTYELNGVSATDPIRENPFEVGLYQENTTFIVSIVEVEDSTGVDSFLNGNKEGEIYNLQGVKVDANKLSKGIYIINGKKVIVK